MIPDKLKPRNYSDVVIGHLESLTDSFLNGNLLSIIPLIVWIAIAAFLWLTIGRNESNPPNQTNVIIQQDDKDSEPTLPRRNQRKWQK